MPSCRDYKDYYKNQYRVAKNLSGTNVNQSQSMIVQEQFHTYIHTYMTTES